MTLIVIGGATASGKSALAVGLAHALEAEIINADSMQLYRGMDIGTAKLTPEEQEGIPHHLLSLVDVRTDVTVSWYQERARAKVDELLATGKHAIVVGGTGLYIKSLLDDLNFPDTNPEVRARLEAEALAEGGLVLHNRLAVLDPAAALAIPVENVRRIVRALEVIEITGKPYTANLPREGSSKYPDAVHFAIESDRDKLDERINLRVEKMWAEGFVEEVRDLVKAGILEGRTAQAAIGYSQIIAMAQGQITEEVAKEATKVATRQYVRRQDTWFRRDERITWLPSEGNHVAAALGSIIKA
jgi:tRNA dimethylallyltransferase